MSPIILSCSIQSHLDKYTTSTKLSSVKVSPYYTYDACNTTFSGPICHIMEVISVRQWWDPTRPWDLGVVPSTRWIHRWVIEMNYFNIGFKTDDALSNLWVWVEVEGFRDCNSWYRSLYSSHGDHCNWVTQYEVRDTQSCSWVLLPPLPSQVIPFLRFSVALVV